MRRRGQSTVEWALVVAVLCVAVVAAAYAFMPTFQDSMESAGEGMSTVYTSGDLAR
jgi:Flp pilus assembly pilin Flp